MLKIAGKLPTILFSTGLFLATKTQISKNNLFKMKLGLFIRLVENDYTKIFTKNLLSEKIKLN